MRKFRWLFMLTALVMVLTMTGSALAAVELSFWDMAWGGPNTYVPVAERLVAQFNEEHPDIHVTYQPVQWQNYYQTFLTAVTGGAAPDVSTGAFPQAVQYAAMDEILDLDPILEKWKAENNPVLDDFLPDILEMERYEGVLAGIPWNADPRQIWYNKDAFDQAGIETMPTTWDEFLEVCKQIKEKTEYIPFNWSAAQQMSTHLSIMLMAQNGTGWSNKDGTGAFEDLEPVVEMLAFIGELYKNEYVAPGIAGYKTADADILFYSEKVAMFFSSPLNQIDQYPGLEDKVFAMPPLAGPRGSSMTYVWPNYVMAFKQTKYPEEARIFLEWWVLNCQPLYFEGGLNSMPARLSTLDNAFYADRKIAQEIKNVVLTNSTTPVYPAPFLYLAFNQIEGEEMPGNAIQEVLTGKTDYERIALDLQKNIQRAFDEYAE
jgi:multiple sugar transport system substrate-binding protein